MRFTSILFQRPEDAARAAKRDEPSFFTDLNLDQILGRVAAAWGEYELKPFFYTPLHEPAAVTYRHGVMRDLEDKAVLEAVKAFTRQIHGMYDQLSQAGQLRYRYQKERWFLDGANTYCQAVTSLKEDLTRLAISSAGFQSFRDYLGSYTASESFRALVSETGKRYDDLAEITYSILIKGSRVRVGKYDGEPDYGTAVAGTFAKFKQGAAKSYLIRFQDPPEMNHIEAQVMNLVARLYPEAFQELDSFCNRHQGFIDQLIRTFYREVQFYVSYMDFIAPLKCAGLRFCYPSVSADSREVYASGAFDLALASKLVAARSAVIGNDFSLTSPERIVVVTGPNQGGKTTFARMFGQLHYLASLGYPVPGANAQLFLADRILSHFEREEDVATLMGKLEDELARVQVILRDATSRSVLIMNESFTSTTLNDALFLGTEVMRQVIELGLLCVYVTFVDELASLSDATVSMVSTVAPDNPAVRTFKVVRRPADGLAYAAALAQKYGLTFERVNERIAS
ncbi:MAG: DNA mismatch repair protein MutS [Actinomycetota bacterium]|nr:DNA mismatch repair protein MutS [Actinomycetota bacterium]